MSLTFSKSTLCNFTAFVGFQIRIYFGRASGYYYTAEEKRARNGKGGKDCGKVKSIVNEVKTGRERRNKAVT
jgi:hypothetical protein